MYFLTIKKLVDGLKDNSYRPSACASMQSAIVFFTTFLFVCPMPVLCRNDFTYRQTFSTVWYGHYSNFSALVHMVPKL